MKLESQMRADLERDVYLIGDQSPQASPRKLNQGLGFFFIMIYDLVVENARLWKYVDDTTITVWNVFEGGT